MKILWFTIALVVSVGAYGQNNGLNLTIPQAQQSFQQDRIRSGDVECSAAIGSSTNVEFGVVGMLNQNDPYYADPYGPPVMSDNFVRDIGVYGRITIPIGAPKERLNCNALYKIELEKRQLELMKLRAEVQRLKNLQFEK